VVAVLVALRVTNWCVQWSGLPASDAVDEISVTLLDSDSLLVSQVLCIVIICICAQTENDDKGQILEVRRNIPQYQVDMAWVTANHHEPLRMNPAMYSLWLKMFQLACDFQ
jgi:hypothetical protein